MILGKLNKSHNTPGYREMNVGMIMVTGTGNEEGGRRGREEGGQTLISSQFVLHTIGGQRQRVVFKTTRNAFGHLCHLGHVPSPG